MTDSPIKTRLLRRDEPAAADLRPLFRDARLLRRGVLSEVRALDDVIHAARTRADALVKDAEARAAALRSTAVAEGRREGLRAYIDQIARVEALEAGARQRAADDVLMLAFRTAERLVGRELDRDDDAFADLVANCVASVSDAPRIVVRVHPANVARLCAAPNRLVAMAGDVPVSVEPDTSLGPADCIIDTARGQVDARLEVRLGALLQALREDV